MGRPRIGHVPRGTAGKTAAVQALVKLIEQHMGKIGPTSEEVPEEGKLTLEQWALLRQA
jgi:hypothetical protein